MAAAGWAVERAHPEDPAKGHGFIDSQRAGIEVFKTIPPTAPLVVVEAVWQYSHHVLAGLRAHRGPILTVANWAGDWPGLVGLLNLNASMTKAGVAYSTLWSEDFTDDWVARRPRDLAGDRHDRARHEPRPRPARARRRRRRGPSWVGPWPAELRDDKAIIGVFDEGCMGMYNAIFDDELLNPIGIYKERLSQSALVAEMRAGRRRRGRRGQATGSTTRACTFCFGTDEATELTAAQVL